MRKLILATRITAVALLLFCGVALKAQTITANINGTVTDSTGAVIPGATVTATNLQTNVQTSTTTNKDGVYNIRFLQIGQYTVTIVAQGFAKQNIPTFTLEVDQDAKIDGHMAVEGATTQVAVQASVAPLLNTENATIATTLDERAIANIPMIGQDYAQLELFVPGAISTSPSGFAGSGAIGHGGGAISINGNRQQQNNYLLDGMDINETINNGSGYIVSSDAIGQVQIISSNAPAEYGNVTGGDIIAIIKNGTNQFHGSVNYYLSDYLLNANSWSNKHNAVITPKSSFTQDLFGATFGGPIFRNKLFFFGDFTGGRKHTGGLSTATVATYDERGCSGGTLGSACTGGTTADFSELLNKNLMCSSTGGTCSSNTKLIQLYNSAASGFPEYGGQGQYATGNQIPIMNPVWQYLFKHNNLYPLPNQAPASTNTPASNNYTAPSKSRSYNNQFDVKGDWKVTDKDSLTGRMSWSNTGSTSTPVLAITFPSAPVNPVRGGAINEIHTFNASMVNEFRAGYTRIQARGAVTLDTTGVFGTGGDAVIGVPVAAQAFAGFAAINSSGSVPSPSSITSSGNGTEYSTVGNSNTGTNYTDDTFLYGDDFTWLKAKHTIKIGAQFLRYQQNNFYPGNDGSLGGFYYLGAGTTDPNPDPLNTNGYSQLGYNFADSILDRASFESKGGVSGPVGMRQWRDAYYVQDDWKVKPNLTLNLGVRYDYVQPISEVNNKMATINPAVPSQIIVAGTPNAAQDAVFPAGTTVVSAASAGYPRSLVFPYYGSVEPRVGLAYSITPRFVIRSGYGIQNYMEGTGANLRMTTNLPFQSAVELSGIPSAKGAPGTPSSLFSTGGGFGGASAGATGGAFNVWDKNIKPAFIGEWNFGVQYEVNNTSSLMLAYTGQSGQHLITANSANQLQNPCVVNGAPVSGATATPSAACLSQAPAPYYTTPTIGYNGTIRYTNSNSDSNYNGLQATYRQRAWHGLQYTVNYTWGRAMTDATGFYQGSAYSENYYNLHLDYGPVNQDVRNSMNWNMVYDLPLGRGRMFGTNMPLVLDEVVGGWKIAMTGVEYSGLPVNISGTSNADVNGAGVQRANHLRTLKIANRSLTNWFGNDPSATECPTAGVDNGTCAYEQPAAGTFGSGHVYSERAPGYQQYDASVSKSFTIWHEQRFEFRTDASNVFNQSELTAPTSTVTSSSFGLITNVRSGVRQLQLDAKYIF